MKSQGSLVAMAAGRGLMAAVAVGSLVVLMDARAIYPSLAWREPGVAPEPLALEPKGVAPGLTPGAFRLSANLPLEQARPVCGALQSGAPSPDGDEALDSTCSGGATVKAVGDLPSAELLSLPGDWLYHRALRF